MNQKIQRTPRKIISSLVLILFCSTKLAALQDTKLLEAAFAGNLDQVTEALQNNANINAVTEGAHATALIQVVYAVMGNYDKHNATYLPILRYLVAQPQIDLNMQTKTTKSSALLLAAHFDNLEMVQALLEAGAAISLPDSQGETAETEATAATTSSIIQLHISKLNLTAQLFADDLREFIINNKDDYSPGTQIADELKNIVREYLG
jgi:ankyrin repeat protein